MVAVAAAYNYYSQGLPDPKDTLSNLSFDQQTTITDRTGKIVLAKLGEFKRELVTFDELPPELLDATTAIEDKDFWSNPGFDVAGFVSATLDTLEGRPARRLDDHPAARPGPPPAGRARSRAAARSGRSARSSSRSASPRPTRARRASRRSSPPTSTRTSTATRATA